MKVYVKKEVYGSHEQYAGSTKKLKCNSLKKKKKKKPQNANAEKIISIQSYK